MHKSHQLILVVVAEQNKGYLKAKSYGGCNRFVQKEMQLGMHLSQDLTTWREFEEFKIVAVYGMKDLNKSEIRDIDPSEHEPCEWLGTIG